MKGDFTRSTFRPKKHYSGVRMQQGRVQLDADWNEQIDISSHRTNTGTRDTIGPCGAPQDGGGFLTGPTGDKKNLTISQGRIYVDGLLCENSANTNITDQEDFPGFKLPDKQGVYLAYLDVWQRHMTAVEDPEIREVALGGPDTATRTKTVWQVKLWQLPDAAVNNGAIQCQHVLPDWQNIIAGSDAELAAFTQQETPSKNPCIVSPGAGYRGLENQLYRVEIHKGGKADAATFKWSRNNGSLAFAIEEILKDASNNPKQLRLKQLGKDKTLSLKAGDWVEVLDDAIELSDEPAGMLVKITDSPDVSGRIITVSQDILGIDMSRHPKVRLWDQGSDAMSVTPPSGSDSIELEQGIFVQFSGSSFKTGDYWLIPARTATGDIEWPKDETKNPAEPIPKPPLGIRHHYCRLAVLEQDNTNIWNFITDCRKLFPAVTELTCFFHVCGDGQEAMPGEKLPQTLQVGVSNGKLPLSGARVRFEITEGGGTLSANNPVSNPPLVVETDTNGVAECTWTLGSMNANIPPPQQVEARLLDACGKPVSVPIRFNANLSVAGEVAYKLPGCTEKNTENGIPTVEELFEKHITGWPPKDANGNTTVKDILDTFLCNFDATDIPIQKDSLLCNRLKNDATVQTVQDALNVLCRGMGGCAVTVGKGGKYETLAEAIEALLKEGQTDICICLLPGEHEVPSLHIDKRISLKIVGCGMGTRVILEELVLSSLSSFAMKDVYIEAMKAKNPLVFEGCEMVTMESCRLETAYGNYAYGEYGALLTIGGASRIYLRNNLIITNVRRLAVVIMDGHADAVFEDNIIRGVVSIYGEANLDDILTGDDIPRLAELLQKDALTLSQSGGILQFRNNSLTGMVAGADIVSSIKQPCKESNKPLYFGKAVIANNIFEIGNNQIIAQHLSLTSNSFVSSDGADAGVVCGYSAIFVGNRANNPRSRLFNVTRSNRKAANLIKIVDMFTLPRIWDETRAPPVPYLWNAYNFAGFYYDLNDNLGKEELLVLQPDLSSEHRVIDINNLVYSTGADVKRLKVVENGFNNDVSKAAAAGLKQTLPGQTFEDGNYTAMYWLGATYVALNGNINELAEFVFEQGALDKKTLDDKDNTWDIGGGWTLTVNSIDAKATPRQAWFTLSKDGVKKDDSVVQQGQVYTYVEKSLGSQTDVPVFVTYVDSIFAGAAINMVQFRYTWAIDTSLMEIKSGDKYGILKVVSLDTPCKRLVLKNTDSVVCLSPGATVNLIGYYSFIVADRDDILRFMPMEVLSLDYKPVDVITTRVRYGRRGAVWNETPFLGAVGGYCNTAKWDAYNSALFYYDITDDLGMEKVEILQTDLNAKQRTIDKGNMVYSTEAQQKMLDVVRWAFNGDVGAAALAGLKQTGAGEAFADGCYYVLGMLGIPGVALNGKVDNIAQLVLAQGTRDKKVVAVGGTWNIGGDWVLTVRSANSSTGAVYLVLSNASGQVIDEAQLSPGKIYTYVEKSIGGETDVPVLVTYIERVFHGATADMVQFGHTWAISTSIAKFSIGEEIEGYEITTLDNGTRSIVIKNTEPKTIDGKTGIGMLMFQVADRTDVLRFMPIIGVMTYIPAKEFGGRISFGNLIKPA